MELLSIGGTNAETQHELEGDPGETISLIQKEIKEHPVEAILRTRDEEGVNIVQGTVQCINDDALTLNEEHMAIYDAPAKVVRFATIIWAKVIGSHKRSCLNKS